MKKDRVYTLFLMIAITAYVLVELAKPDPVDFTSDFTRTKTIPYATKILHEELGTLFPEQQISGNEETLYYLPEEDSAKLNWIFLNSTLEWDEYEAEQILQRVENGSTVFLGGLIRGYLADTLNIEYTYNYSYGDSLLSGESISAELKSDELNINRSWDHKADITYNYLSSYDTLRTSVLGYWENSQANFIRIQWGEGFIYHHSSPHLFTNYYLRKPELAEYAFIALSHMPVRDTVWDQYYKDGRAAGSSPLYVIFSIEALKYAWITAFITLILFMVFKAKRLQRIIPVMRKPENSTLAFTRTISELYFEQGNHSELFKKKFNFFVDYINSHLRLQYEPENDIFREQLAMRSGVDHSSVNELIDGLELMRSSTKLTDRHLKKITDQIDQFYKLSQR
jgi:hypothetical protein